MAARTVETSCVFAQLWVQPSLHSRHQGEEIEQKDEELGRKDQQIAALTEQLKRLLPSEGMPPDRLHVNHVP